MAVRKVKVWNDNTAKLVEEFKGKTYEIEAGKHIVMGRSQAIQFKGQYKQIKMDGMKQQSPESMKILRLEPISGNTSEDKEWICNIDGRSFKTKQGLDNYMKKNHPDAETLKD